MHDDLDTQCQPACRKPALRKLIELSDGKPPSSALARPRLRSDDPQIRKLIHDGQNFGRTVSAFANIESIFIAGLNNQPVTEEQYREMKELKLYKKLLAVSHGLEDVILNSKGEEELTSIAAFLQKGLMIGRFNDIKSLKSAVLDWIVPIGNERLDPPLRRGTKTGRGFHHDRTGSLLCPVGLDWNKDSDGIREMVIGGDQWPIFLYENEIFDPEDPWKGLLRNQILVQGFKHIFKDENNGMTQVTAASIAYTSAQIRFALSSTTIFARSDKETLSEVFYNSILELLEDPEELEEVEQLLTWWNKRVTPTPPPVLKRRDHNGIFCSGRFRVAVFGLLAVTLSRFLFLYNA
ncbi:hypothetical protein DFP72DRAFT_943149 [Ephemerocybe angulata]|uniref:Uncharacterized protein n=1 Tax=Ephemerocybe angulata TaxID=980116 RepID=A0A8H6LT03_9AGAR|nr:hypothetical protein DFP72DRAFT_947135 [Tulosesus angulatus]KAF6741575.1 hypothetical protein DFP72DRAFT_943149 [Tulosesus angulatus]